MRTSPLTFGLTDALAGWTRAEGTASGAVATRQVVVFHPPNDLETNVNIITTLASVELTKLSSLGSAYEFGFHLVTSQDRRGRKKGAQVAELLSTEERDGAYLVEYTIEVRSSGATARNAVASPERSAACTRSIYTRVR